MIRRIASEAALGVCMGAFLVVLAAGGLHAWLKGRAQ